MAREKSLNLPGVGRVLGYKLKSNDKWSSPGETKIIDIGELQDSDDYE